MYKSQIFCPIKKDGVTLLKFKSLNSFSFINHAVSTRHGGVSSKNNLKSLNLGTQTDDSPENVLENYRRFCACAGFDINKLVLGKQTHSTNVRKVTQNDWGKGVIRERDYTDVDSLITNVKNTPLVIHTADCVPVSFVHLGGKAIGNAHCGWRGTFGELAKKTVEALCSEYEIVPGDIFCTIGPCICQKCYEVSGDLYLSFKNKFPKSEALLEKSGTYYIDLAGLNFEILINCGVKKDNIVTSDLCTCCRTDIFFSHRGLGPERGIIASALELV